MKFPFFNKKPKEPEVVQEPESPIGAIISFIIDEDSNISIDIDSSDDEQMLHDLSVVIYAIITGRLTQSIVDELKISEDPNLVEIINRLKALNNQDRENISRQAEKPLVHPLSVFGASKIMRGE